MILIATRKELEDNNLFDYEKIGIDPYKLCMVLDDHRFELRVEIDDEKKIKILSKVW